MPYIMNSKTTAGDYDVERGLFPSISYPYTIAGSKHASDQLTVKAQLTEGGAYYTIFDVNDTSTVFSLVYLGPINRLRVTKVGANGAATVEFMGGAR